MVENPLVRPEFGSFPANGFPWSCQHFQITPNHWSEHNKVLILSTFASALRVFGCPLPGSYWTSSRPSSDRLFRSEMLDFFTAYSPQANVNRANVSLSLLPILTQHWMSIRCSRFLSLTVPPTAYHEHGLLPERLIGSVAHVNASWNMSVCAACCGHSGN
jgi:hypothetical protein